MKYLIGVQLTEKNPIISGNANDNDQNAMANPTTSGIQPFPSTETNSTLAMSPSSTLNPEMIIPEVIKTVNDPSLSQKNDQKAATLPAKTNEPTQENSRKQKGTTKSVTINHTLMPQRNDQQILSQQSTLKIILRSNSEPSKVTSHQGLLESYSLTDEKMSKIIDILKSLRYS